MVDWAEELKKKLQSSQGVDETVKESVSRAADDLAKGEQKIEELSRERESVKQRLLEKVSSIKENFEQGKTYFEDKDFLRAEENFKLVLEIDPSNKEAQSYLEKIYRKIGKPDREAEAEITAREKTDEDKTALPADQDADILSAFEGLKKEKEQVLETREKTMDLSATAPVMPVIVEVIPEEQKAGEPAMKEEETADLKNAFADLKKEMLKREEEPVPATAQEYQEPPAVPAEEKPAEVPPEPAPVDTDLTSAFSVLKEEIQNKARPEEKLPVQEAPSPEPAAAPAAEKAPAAAENKEEAKVPADEDLKAALSELTKETAPEKKQEPAEQAPEDVDIASALGKLDTLKETAAKEEKPAVLQEVAKPAAEASGEKKGEKETAAQGDEDVSDEEFEKLLKESGISGEAAAPAVQATAAAPAAAGPEKPAPSSAEAKPAVKEEAKAQATPSPAASAAAPVSAKPAEAEAPKKGAEEVQIKEMTAEEVIKEQKTAAQPEGAKKEAAPAPAQEKPKEAKKTEASGLKKFLHGFAPLAVAAVIGMVIASGIMLVVFSQPGKKGSPTEEILDQGIRYVQEGDLAKGSETLSQLEKTFQENNTLMEKYIQAADVIYESETVNADEKVEKYKKAKRIYEQIIGTFPGSPSIIPLYFKAADCSRKLGLFEEAIDAYRKIIETFTDASVIARAKYSKAETLDEMKKYDEARELYLSVIEVYPDSEFAVRAYFKLAESFRSQADDLRKEPANE